MCLRTIQRASLTEASPTIGFPGGVVVKNLPANAEEEGLIPGLGRSSGEENSNPLQYSCLENPMNRGDWWTAVCGVAKSQTQLTETTKVLLLILFNDSAWRQHIRYSDLYLELQKVAFIFYNPPNISR